MADKRIKQKPEVTDLDGGGAFLLQDDANNDKYIDKDNLSKAIRDYLIDNQTRVSAVLDAEYTETITTGEVYQAVSGSFTNDPLDNFTLVSTPIVGIKYTGTEDIYIDISGSSCFSANANNTTVSLGLNHYDGATTTLVQKMCVFCKNLGQKYNCPLAFKAIQISTNDILQLVITADTTGRQITISEYTLKLKSLGSLI